MGFSGTQLSPALQTVDAVRSRGIRIAEVYAALPCTSSGSTSEARTLTLDRLEALQRHDADVLVFSHHLSDERVGWAGRANQPGVDALRARVFTELGAGVLDVVGVIRELAALDYGGWVMCEQDATRRPPSESATISQAVLRYAIRLAEA